MGVFKRRGSPCRYIIFEHDGRRLKASSGTANKNKARAIEATMRADLLAGKSPTSLPKITLGEAITRYIEAVIRPKGNARLLSADGYLLGRLKRDLGASALLTDLSASRIASYRDKLLGESLAPATVNRYLDTIVALLNRCMNDWAWLRVVPKVKLLKLNNARHRWLSTDEEARLLAHCPNHCC